MPARTNRRSSALLTLSVLCSGSLAALGPHAVAASGTIVSGTISSDTTWTTAGSPYLVHGPIEIPAGVTLTVDPGVLVDVPYSFLTDGKGVFNVSGALDVNGTAAAPVELDGGSREWNTSLARVYETGGATPTVEIDHARIHDYTAVVGVGSAGGRFELTNSSIHRAGGTHLATGPGSLVADNFFEDAGGIRLSGSPIVTVTGNRFRENGYSWFSNDPFVSSQGASGVPDEVHLNTFESEVRTDGTSPRPAVSVAPDGAVDARNNFWHTTDLTVVAGRIYDNQDNPTWSSSVPVQPLLTAPAPRTPIAAPHGVIALTSTSATDSTATVSWQAPASDGGSPVTAYQVSVTAAGITATAPSGARSLTVSGLAPSTLYGVVVTAVNAAGTSLAREARVLTQSSPVVSPPTVPMPSPSPSTSPTPTTNSGIRPPDTPARPVLRLRKGNVLVRWTAPATHNAAINRYVVTYRKKGSKRAMAPKVPGSRLKYVIRDLPRGTYLVTVTASTVAGLSAPSPTAKIKVPAHS